MAVEASIVISGLSGADFAQNETKAFVETVEELVGGRVEVTESERRRLDAIEFVRVDFVVFTEVATEKTVAEKLQDAFDDGTLTSTLQSFGSRTRLGEATVFSVAVYDEVTRGGSSKKKTKRSSLLVVVAIVLLCTLALSSITFYWYQRSRSACQKCTPMASVHFDEWRSSLNSGPPKSDEPVSPCSDQGLLSPNLADLSSKNCEDEWNDSEMNSPTSCYDIHFDVEADSDEEDEGVDEDDEGVDEDERADSEVDGPHNDQDPRAIELTKEEN